MVIVKKIINEKYKYICYTTLHIAKLYARLIIIISITRTSALTITIISIDLICPFHLKVARVSLFLRVHYKPDAYGDHDSSGSKTEQFVARHIHEWSPTLLSS